MPVITRSVVVDAPVGATFEISNQIDQWPRIVPEYLRAEILRREGRKIWFRLTNEDSLSWVSWRMLYPPYLAYAERFEPVAPFAYNQLTWVYHALPGNRTHMTWDMYFELPAERKHEENTWAERLAAHTEANQKAMRTYIEKAVTI
jgi:aromatase